VFAKYPTELHAVIAVDVQEIAPVEQAVQTLLKGP